MKIEKKLIVHAGEIISGIAALFSIYSLVMDWLNDGAMGIGMSLLISVSVVIISILVTFITLRSLPNKQDQFDEKTLEDIGILSEGIDRYKDQLDAEGASYSFSSEIVSEDEIDSIMRGYGYEITSNEMRSAKIWKKPGSTKRSVAIPRSAPRSIVQDMLRVLRVSGDSRESAG